jgi:hypothetical protein
MKLRRRIKYAAHFSFYAIFFHILCLYIWNFLPYWSIVSRNTTEWFFYIFSPISLLLAYPG